jgi:hypothetical protein
MGTIGNRQIAAAATLYTWSATSKRCPHSGNWLNRDDRGR